MTPPPIRLPKPADARRNRDHAAACLNALTDQTIIELLHRAGVLRADGKPADPTLPWSGQPDAVRHDGYPPGATGGARGGGVARPVEAAVIALDEHGATPDPVALAVARIFASLTAAKAALEDLDRVRQDVLANPRFGRTSSLTGDCQACQRPVSGSANDRLRAGYCDACRMAWERAGRPDRPAFERRRRKELADRDGNEQAS